MKSIARSLPPLILILAVLTVEATFTWAQEVSIPDPGLNAAIRETLQVPVGPLTGQALLGLTNLNAGHRDVRSTEGLEAAPNLVSLDLQRNHLTSFSLPSGLTNLTSLDLSFNSITNCVIPGGADRLTTLVLADNQLTTLALPTTLSGLTSLNLEDNGLISFNLPSSLTNLVFLDLGFNSLADLVLPAGLTNLIGLIVSENQLTNLVLPSDLGRLDSLNLNANQLTELSVPAGLTNLTGLFVTSNQLTQLVLPPDMTKLSALCILANPLATLVLSEPLAASTKLTETLDSLRNQGVSVLTYPLAVQLVRLQQPLGAFRFGVTGPPGAYIISTSPDLEVWSVLGSVTNPLGSIFFTDVTAHLSPQKYYRALPQSPPADMVFIPPNTFTLGSSEDEVGHSADEGPQTVVTLSHGFWMAKYPVTQGEYLAVMGVNPSGFPGDPNRPVESVTWPDATNYCAALTQLDLAAARIPPGSHYRLPTEAEWECAARAGTSTRFYYGADADLTGLADHAWYGANSGLTPHSVGQREPNAWGLYDMAGNVWEWCQDWYGSYPGGSARDPQGPASNSIGFKVIRGGAWEASEFDCRSASRWFEPANPFISDFIIGFRVVLAVEP